MKLHWCTPFIVALSLFLSALLTPVKAQTPTATPGETSSQTAPGLVETALNLPGGDCFKSDPGAMTTDPITERLYLLCRSTDQGETEALLVLNSRTDEQIAFIPLDETWFPEYARTSLNTYGFLTLDTSAQRLYLSGYHWSGILVLDTVSLTKIRWLPLNVSSIVAVTQDRLYAREGGGLTAYHSDDMTEVSHISDVRPLAYHPISQRLYVVAIKETGGWELQIRRGDDLTLEKALPLPGEIIDSALNTQTDRLYLLIQEEQIQGNQSRTKSQLLAVDDQSLTITSQDLNSLDLNAHGLSLLVDKNRGYLYLINDSTGWLVIHGQTLAILSRHQRTDFCHNPFSSGGKLVIDANGQILWASPQDTLLHRYNPVTGVPGASLPLRRRLVAATVHPQDGRLYFIDALGTLNVLDGTSLQPLSHLKLIEKACSDYYPDRINELLSSDHQVYLALDPERKRLFVGDQHARQTLVLDSDILNTLDLLPVVGPMTLDVAGGRLFLVDDYPGEKDKTFIHTFDTATLTELQPAENPTGEISKYELTFILNLTFAQPSGQLFLHNYIRSEQSGGSGAGSWQSYSIYDPNTMTFLGNLPTDLEWAGNVAFSSNGQRTYMAFTHQDGQYGRIKEGSGDPIFKGLLIFDQAGRLLRQINGPFGPLATDDQYIYLLQDRYLLALDAQALEKPNQPYLAAVLPLEHTYENLALAQGRLYLWSGQRVATMATTDLLTHSPQRSLQTGPFETAPSLPPLDPIGHLGGRPGPVAVQGHYAYAAFGPELAVLDIADPTQPHRLGYVLLPNTPDGYYEVIHHVAVAGNYVYVATEQAGLRIINVSNPTTPIEVGFYAPNFPWATQTIHQVAIAGHYAYLAAGEWGLRVLDISNPTQPSEVGFYEFEAVMKEWVPGVVKDVAVVKTADRTYVYALVLEEGSSYMSLHLHLLDVSNPTRPTELDLASSLPSAAHLAIEGHFLYLAGSSNDYPVREPSLSAVLNISDPTTPIEVSLDPNLNFPYQGHVAWGMTARAEAYVLVSAGEALKVMDISNPAAPHEVGAYSTNLDEIDAIAINGTYAYLAQGNSLSIADLSDPTQPAIVSIYELDPDPPDYYGVRRVAAVNEYLYVLDTAGSLQILDITRPAAPAKVGVFDASTSAQDMVVVGDKTYLVDNCAHMGGYLNGIRVLDVSRPTHPVEDKCYPLPEESLYVKGRDIYASAIERRWGRLDLSNLTQPTLLNPPFVYSDFLYHNFEANPPYLYFIDDNIYSSSSFSSLRVIDLSDRFNLITVGAYQTLFPGLYGAKVIAEGEYIYTTSHTGLFIFRLN